MRNTNSEDFRRWVARSGPGDKLCYFTGELSREIELFHDKYVIDLKKTVMEFSERKKVALTQERVGVNCFDYFATKRRDLKTEVENHIFETTR